MPGYDPGNMPSPSQLKVILLYLLREGIFKKNDPGLTGVVRDGRVVIIPSRAAAWL